MNSFETWLQIQRRKSTPFRNALARAAFLLPPPLQKPALRIVWDSKFRHMRFLPKDISLRPGKNHCWTILRNNVEIARSRPLCDLVKLNDLPVSIVATGPSALDYPWDNLRKNKRFLIAVNGAPTMLKQLGIAADLMVVTDREFALTGAHHFDAGRKIPLVIEFLAGAALASQAPDLLNERPFAIIERVNMWHGIPSLKHEAFDQLNPPSDRPFVFPSNPDPRCLAGWSHRPDLGFFPGRTVVFAALQVAIGLGATDVEIIGMDLSGSGRSYTEGPAARPTQLQEHYQESILPSFRVMCDALAGTGIKVTNLSPVCPLPPDLFINLGPRH